jgi:hypothetical protein
MKSLKATLTFCFFLSSLGLNAEQTKNEQVKIKWQEPQSDVDVKGANESDKRFQKRVFRRLEQHLNQLAEDLPQGITLELLVSNVNLAGDVRYNFAMNQEIRLVEHIYWPMMAFQYKVKSGDSVVLEDEVKIKDMAFMDRIMLGSRRDFLSYEKRMLKDWFERKLLPQVEQAIKQHNAVMQ